MTAPVTALLTVKTCPDCGAKAPYYHPIPHATGCDGDSPVTAKLEPWALEPGDEVVTIAPSVLP